MDLRQFFFSGFKRKRLFITSGVARVPCALGQEIFLRTPSTKLIEFELKKIGANVRKKKKQNICCSCLVLFRAEKCI